MSSRSRTVGRPSQIDRVTEDICKKAHKLALLGCTHEGIAEQLGISTKTFYNWLKRSKAFLQAVKSGSVEADSEVASALFKSATGFTRTVERVSKDGDVVATDEEVAPNAVSAIFWLKNRQRTLWRDVRQNEMSGPDGGPISTEFIPVKTLEPRDRARLRAFLEANVTDVEDENEEAGNDEDDAQGDPGDAQP